MNIQSSHTYVIRCSHPNTKWEQVEEKEEDGVNALKIQEILPGSPHQFLLTRTSKTENESHSPRTSASGERTKPFCHQKKKKNVYLAK